MYIYILEDELPGGGGGIYEPIYTSIYSIMTNTNLALPKKYDGLN